eukprot:4728766-Pleurochrysis_carterae.AAC.2
MRAVPAPALHVRVHLDPVDEVRNNVETVEGQVVASGEEGDLVAARQTRDGTRAHSRTWLRRAKCRTEPGVATLMTTSHKRPWARACFFTLKGDNDQHTKLSGWASRPDTAAIDQYRQESGESRGQPHAEVLRARAHAHTRTRKRTSAHGVAASHAEAGTSGCRGCACARIVSRARCHLRDEDEVQAADDGINEAKDLFHAGETQALTKRLQQTTKTRLARLHGESRLLARETTHATPACFALLTALPAQSIGDATACAPSVIICFWHRASSCGYQILSGLAAL